MIADDIKNGESSILEFKRELPKDTKKLLKTFIAFANGEGGRVIFGVENATREVCGISDEKLFPLMDSISNMIADNCVPQIIPQITFQNIDDKTIVVVEIRSGQNTPYYLKSEGVLKGVYLRSGAITIPAEQEKVKELILNGSHQSYDEQIISTEPVKQSEIDYLCNIITELNGEHRQKISAQQLGGWKLLKRENDQWYPSVAFDLLTRNSFHFATIQCALFKGTEKVNFIDRKEFSGPLYQQIEDAFHFVLQHINIGAKIVGLHREDIYEIPPSAIRELIVNAVMHRNYLLHSSIQISIFDNRIEIQSPGMLFNGLTIEQMISGCSSIRNVAIAEIFQKMKIVEKWGTGVQRIFSECQKAGILSPQYTIKGEFLIATLLRGNSLKSPDEVKSQLPEPDNSRSVAPKSDSIAPKVDSVAPKTDAVAPIDKEFAFIQPTLVEIQRNPSVSVKELGAILNLSVRTIKYHLKYLKEKGIIARMDGNRSGYWIIQNNNTTNN